MGKEEKVLNKFGRTKKKNPKYISLVFDDVKVDKQLVDEKDSDTFYDCYFRWEDAYKEIPANETNKVPVNFTEAAQKDFMKLKNYTDVFLMADKMEQSYNCSGFCTAEPLFYMAK